MSSLWNIVFFEDLITDFSAKCLSLGESLSAHQLCNFSRNHMTIWVNGDEKPPTLERKTHSAT